MFLKHIFVLVFGTIHRTLFIGTVHRRVAQWVHDVWLFEPSLVLGLIAYLAWFACVHVLVWWAKKKLAKGCRLGLGLALGLTKWVKWLSLGVWVTLSDRLTLLLSLTHFSFTPSHSRAPSLTQSPKPKHYSSSPLSLALTPCWASISRRTWERASPRSRLRVDAKIAKFRQGFGSRVW